MIDRQLGFDGHVVDPSSWGRLVNGGAWLTIDGQRVDLHYRDLDQVEHWTREADAGRFEVENVAGHIVGLPTYVLAGELATNRVLVGTLPRLIFSEALRHRVPPWWKGDAVFSLLYADT
jgi:hypothetical protein